MMTTIVSAPLPVDETLEIKKTVSVRKTAGTAKGSVL